VDSRKRNNAHRRGLTIIEVILVAVVLAICAAIVVPHFIGATETEVLAAARMVAADLQYAQNHAITHQEEVTVSFDVAGDLYSLSNASGTLEHPIEHRAYVVDFQTEPNFKQLEVISASFAGSTDITFDAMGSPDNGGAVTVQSGSTQYRIQVAATTGNVTVSRVGS